MASSDSKVHVSITLHTSEPHQISISDPAPASTLALIAEIRQIASPRAGEPITLLTNFSALDATETDAFKLLRMAFPQCTTDPDKRILMKPISSRVTYIRLLGDLDIRKRDDLVFVTVPAIDQGAATVRWSLNPEHMLRFYDGTLEEKLSRFQPGEVYRIKIRSMCLTWWTFGALDGDLADKKFARWMLPADVDEGGDVSSRLLDRINRHSVNRLSSQSCVENEEKPDVEKMTKEGWVFSENEDMLEVECPGQEEGTTFKFVE